METEKIVWSSSVDEEMIESAGLTTAEVKALVKELDDAVMRVCLDFSVC
jgi:hypothetical protein